MLGKSLSAVVMIAASILFCVGPVSAEPIVIKFSIVVSESSPKGQMASKFKELVAERFNDEVVVEVYPNSSLFTDDKILEALLLNDAQLGAPALSKFSRFTKKLQLYDLPFLFQDIGAVDRFQSSEAGQALLMSMEKRGVLGLGYLHNGMKQLSATKRPSKPSDISGLKFRIMSSDVLEAQFKAVGAEPLKRPFSQVYTLLQSKTLDGQENTWSNIYSKKFFEVQPYIVESNHGLLDYMVITSKRFWNSLPDDIRPEIKKALDEAIAFGNSVALEKAKADRQKIIDANICEVVQLSPSERAQWVEAMKPVWQQFESDIGKELIDAAFSSNQSGE